MAASVTLQPFDLPLILYCYALHLLSNDKTPKPSSKNLIIYNLGQVHNPTIHQEGMGWQRMLKNAS